MYLSVAMFAVESFIQPFPGESAVIPVGRHPSRIKLASTLQTFFPPPPSKKLKFNSSGTTPPDTQTTHRRQSCSRRSSLSLFRPAFFPLEYCERQPLP